MRISFAGLLSIALLIIISGSASAQRFHINLAAGLANYTGDLNDKRYSFKQAQGAMGVGLEYELSDRFMMRGMATFARVSANDKYGKFAARNLSFTSFLMEASYGLEYFLKDPYSHQITPYVFAGVSVFRFNPYTMDDQNRKAYLRPLSTEGQGIIPGRDEYNINQFAIPFGGGWKYNVSDNFRLGLELGLRKTFTDYLDDVSTTYVDESLLMAQKGGRSVELAYRADELKAGSYPAAGTPRGGQKYKDWYYTTMLTASFRLGGGNNSYAGKTRRGLGCPSAF